MMQRVRFGFILLSALLLAVPQSPAATDSLPRVEAKTFDKEKFVFPDDMDASRLNVVFLALTKDQDVGEYLQQALLDWDAELQRRGALVDGVKTWHFPVISGLPFFIKGVVTRAMRKQYDGKIPLSQAGVLYVKDSDDFAAAAGLVIDDQATIVLTSGTHEPLQVFKGDVTPAGSAEVAAAIAAYLADAN